MIFGFGKRTKYGNKKVEYNGKKFDSKKERDRFIFLEAAQRDGLITDLERQVRFELIPAITEEYEVQLKTKTVTRTRTVQRAITYTCDFMYYVPSKNLVVVEDVKSSPRQTAIDKSYVLKKKMMLALKGIKVKEVYKSQTDI